MKKTLCILPFVLLGCAKQSVTNDIITNAENSVQTLEKTLTADCKTEGVLSQLYGLKMQINSIRTSCQTEKDIITDEKLRWKWAFFGLLAMIGAYIARKLIK